MYGYSIIAHNCSWVHDALKYDGLCSHNPLTKFPASNQFVSTKELEAKALETAQRLNDHLNSHTVPERRQGRSRRPSKKSLTASKMLSSKAECSQRIRQNITIIERRVGEAESRISYKDLEADRRDVQIYSWPPKDGRMRIDMAFCNDAIPHDAEI